MLVILVGLVEVVVVAVTQVHQLLPVMHLVLVMVGVVY
jgi:hypothetical protein